MLGTFDSHLDGGFFAYSWKLPAYSGPFLLTIDNFSFVAYSWSFFACSEERRLIRALRDCKQRSLTVSKKAPTVSKKLHPLILPLVQLSARFGAASHGYETAE